MKNLFLASITLLLCYSPSIADFILNRNILNGIGVSLGHIVYGDGRNDGTNRFYGVEGHARYAKSIYEITVTASGEVLKEDIDYDPDGEGSTNILIEDLRGDGLKRLYVARGSDSPWLYGALLEYEYNSGEWKKTTIAQVGWHNINAPRKIDHEPRLAVTAFTAGVKTKIAAGDLRGDGKKRLYFNNSEYTFQSGEWVITATEVPAGKIIMFADARNDGNLRLYGGISQKLLETGYMSEWFKVELPAPYYGEINSNIVIGPARNDGVNRIYTKYVPLYEYIDETSWESGEWIHRRYKIEEYKEISTGVGFAKVEGAQASNLTVTAIGDGRNNGVDRLYLVGGGDVDIIVELTWNGSGWDRKDYPLEENTISGQLFTFMITDTPLRAGVLRNRVMKLSTQYTPARMNKAYTSSGDEYIFAYPQPAYDTTKTTRDKLQPVNNYFKRGDGWASVWYSLDEAGSASLKVYNMRGELVRTLFDGHKAAGEYCEVWTGRNEHGDICSTGVYLVKLVTPRGAVTKKICMIK